MTVFDTEPEYYKLHSIAFNIFFTKLIQLFRGELSDDAPNFNELELVLARKFELLSTCVFNLFEYRHLKKPLYENKEVPNGRIYFLYLCQDAAHEGIIDYRGAMETWMLLSAVYFGHFAGPVLNSDKPAYDGLMYGPFFHETHIAAASLNNDSSLKLRHKNETLYNVDVKFPTPGNSMQTIYENCIQKPFEHDDPTEYLLVAAFAEPYLESFLTNSEKERVVWCEPVFYGLMKCYAQLLIDRRSPAPTVVHKTPKNVTTKSGLT